MEFFKNSKFDFMRMSPLFLGLSALVFLGALAVLFGLRQLNLGIDFAGGTQLTIKFQEEKDPAEIRSLLEGAGIEGAQVQRFGDVGEHEVIIKTPLAEDVEGGDLEGTDPGSRDEVVAAFNARYNGDLGGVFDLNEQGSDALATVFFTEDPEGLRGGDDDLAARERYREIAQEIMEVRKQDGIIRDLDSLAELPSVTPGIAEVLRSRTGVGAFNVLANDVVGPQIGGELRLKGILAVTLSLLGMLLYIWLRFELRFGIGALAALTHDVVICLGIYALMGYEFDLTTIAAFLTVVGYSVNDSVVVFDRVRENLRKNRRAPLNELLNLSLNQTLSRTVLTSGTTLLAVGTLYAFGGDVIRGFAFIVLIGVVIGTYSSIFIASPFVLFWERFFGREARTRRSAATA
ncbi:MAG: protein translocase subunit SecF [Acidobacteriota bacterium]